MKLFRILLVSALLLLTYSALASAGDFSWISDFNIQAQADPSGFRTNLATRFHIGDLQVNAVLRNFDNNPSDAYLALRLGEMSGRPVHEVIEQYKRHKGQGWGRLAQRLGIKPGSAEFHALKQGDELEGSPFRKGHHGHGKDHERNSKHHGKAKKHKKW